MDVFNGPNSPAVPEVQVPEVQVPEVQVPDHETWIGESLPAMPKKPH